MDIPSISDDVLQCIIYLLKDDETAVLVTQIMTFVEKMIPDHIWHRDSFELTLSKESKGAIECTMRVGDSIDDEWLVVYLLWQVTKQFSVAASVCDADGQFLLIEAADKLPAWVTPENVENRVWIYQGHLHIVPLSSKSRSDAGRERRSRLNAPDADYDDEITENGPYISQIDAIKVIQDPSIQTQVSKDVEAIILARISGYPDAAKSQIHRTKVALPTDISKVLASNPNLIQKAVECFYTRDPLQLRTTQKMARFPPSSSSVVTVRMTRTAYAQIMGQRFNAPRIFQRPLDQTAEEERWWDNGVKIACGFEMLYQEARVRKEGLQVDRSEQMDRAKIEALRRDTGFVNYIAKLEHTDYFEGEMKDSERWKEKEKQAAKSWITMRQADDASRPSFADLVNSSLRTHPEASLLDEGEDSDDWLHVEPMDLERSLNHYGQQDEEQAKIGDMEKDSQDVLEDQIANEQARRLKSLADKMEDFVEGEGVLEGAVFEDDMLSDDDDDDEEDDDDDVDSEEDQAKRKAAMDALVAPLDPGDYGKMPVEYRHPNSQLTASGKEAEDKTMEVEEISTFQSKPDQPSRPIRKPIFQRDKFDGVDSDDETSEEGEEFIEDEETGDDQPQVVGEIEVDMEQEQEDFLRFSREMLGIDDAAWANIIADRRKRGAYIPPGMKSNLEDTRSEEEVQATRQNKGPSAARFFDEIPQIAVTSRPQRSTTTSAKSSTEANPDLNSFEAVMEAMEKELERLKSPRSSASGTPSAGTRNTRKEGRTMAADRKGKRKAVIPMGGMEEEDDEDEEMVEFQQAMDMELKSALKRDTEVVSSEEEEDGDSENEVPMDYNLIKNFLQSFKSQQGLSGPVGGLAGRLQGSDWALPRDG